MDASNDDGYEKILPIAEAYNTLYKEYKDIIKDINTYKSRFQPKLKELKKKMEELEKMLIQFMKEKNYPGIRYKEVLLLQENKGTLRFQQRKQLIMNELRQSNVTPMVEQRVRDILELKNPQESEQKTKLKVVVNTNKNES